jgi:hypothetical protein
MQKSTDRKKHLILALTYCILCTLLFSALQMWLHAGGVYLLTLVSAYFLYLEFRFYRTLRHEYLIKRAPHLRTIVVEVIHTTV